MAEVLEAETTTETFPIEFATIVSQFYDGLEQREEQQRTSTEKPYREKRKGKKKRWRIHTVFQSKGTDSEKK
ncbi:MAG TPA: hypothetical protein HPP83_09935 [Candidatus Hydrogenedentes bacterium]|nr:hypothetical protein [Candidatus Hydrogenedentota bacterium]